ncbi:MAG TPA: hypothetical protein VFL55_19290 [Acetobacteraceae bacterium]|nr:hypothetical protein [Acetobacteraceae bacterium]
MNVALTPVFIPASGWVADRYSTQTVFRATVAVFTRGPVLCGRGDILAFLAGPRVLQGVGRSIQAVLTARRQRRNIWLGRAIGKSYRQRR